MPALGLRLRGSGPGHLPGTDRPEEVAEAGDAYHFQAGHVLVYDEPSEVLEINPPAELAVMMDHVERLAGGGDSGGAPS